MASLAISGRRNGIVPHSVDPLHEDRIRRAGAIFHSSSEHLLTHHSVISFGAYASKLAVFKEAEETLHKNEVRILRRLGKQRHLVGALKLTLKEPLLIFERISGVTLLEFLDLLGEPMDEEGARLIFQGIICGLSHCHAVGVAHHDLSSTHVMIDVQAEVKLIDFGTATFFDPIDPEALICRHKGRVRESASPEIFTQETHADPCLDIWSAGCLLFLLLHKRPLFELKGDEGAFLTDLCGPMSFFTPLNFSGSKKIAFDPTLTPLCRDLLTSLLQRDPLCRATLSEIESHAWLWSRKSPCL